MTYEIHLEKFGEVYDEVCFLFAEHYAEMQRRLESKGIKVSPFAMRVKVYEAYNDQGWMRFYVLRKDGNPVGYGIVYVTQDMHNGDQIAQEDALYVLKEHRNGIGKSLVRHVIADLAQLGVKRLIVSAVTDLRVSKLWRRMGFKDLAMQMVYEF